MKKSYKWFEVGDQSMAKLKVLLTRKLQDFALEDLRKDFLVEIHSGKIPMPKKTLIKKINSVDGLICFPYDRIDKDVIDSAKNLKVISTFSVGFDHIDTKYAKKKGIFIGYTPEVLNSATADLAFALLIDVMRRVSEGDRVIRTGNWSQIYGADDYVGFDLQEKTLGIIGMGRIGTEFAKRVKPFGLKVIYHNRRRLESRIEKQLDVRYSKFNDLIQKSDVISIHVPLTKESEYMFTLKTFKKMKKTAVLINTSRGKVVKEKDLVVALKKKMIFGAGLDVYELEPISKKNPLTKLENVVLAPHIGSSTKETRKRMAEVTVENLKRGINGITPKYPV